MSGSASEDVASVAPADRDQWRTLLVEAYSRFHDELGAMRNDFPGLTPYDPVERAKATQGTFAWWWGAASEIRETINTINAWGGQLHDWGAWNRVIDSYASEDDKWEISSHFVETIAFFCMLQPSSLADRLVVVAETALHQANQRVFPDEPDKLEQDRLKPGAILRRSDRLRQLNRLGNRWTAYTEFRTAMDALNDSAYRNLTRNFRDLSAHSLAPRLLLGHVSRATRSIAPKQDLVRQTDGTYLQVEHPTKKMVQYSMNDFPPLSLNATREANLIEYQKARCAMVKFATLIDELCDQMDRAPKRASKGEGD